MFTILDPEYADTQAGTLHFRYLADDQFGHLHAAATLEEHAAQLQRAVDGEVPGDLNERFLRRFVRPFGLDVRATDRAVDAIEALGSRGPLPAARGPAAGPAVRLALEPLAKRAAAERRRQKQARSGLQPAAELKAAVRRSPRPRRRRRSPPSAGPAPRRMSSCTGSRSCAGRCSRCRSSAAGLRCRPARGAPLVRRPRRSPRRPGGRGRADGAGADGRRRPRARGGRAAPDGARSHRSVRPAPRPPLAVRPASGARGGRAVRGRRRHLLRARGRAPVARGARRRGPQRGDARSAGFLGSFGADACVAVLAGRPAVVAEPAPEEAADLGLLARLAQGPYGSVRAVSPDEPDPLALLAGDPLPVGAT